MALLPRAVPALAIAAELSLPLETVTQSVAILAKRRMGKSYLARRLAEQLFASGQQLVIIDPKGDWWGIRSSADGKSDGLPILIMGGEHGDIPLDPGAGEVIAKLIVEETVSVLLDLSELRKHEVATFMAIFLETLYRLKAREQYRIPVMVLTDEADAIAPQKPAPNEARMLGAFDDLVRRGGQRGIGVTFITQRSAVLSKDVLTQAQILITLRVIAPQDLAAIKAWVDVHGTPEERKTLMASLPSLPVGDAWVWSPGWPTDTGIFQRIHTLPISTFDSGATPKPGQRASAPKRLADIDLESVKRQMSDTLERVKQEDPKLLRNRIQELEQQLKTGKAVDTDRVKQLEQRLADREKDAADAIVGMREIEESLEVLNRELHGISMSVNRSRHLMGVPLGEMKNIVIDGKPIALTKGTMLRSEKGSPFQRGESIADLAKNTSAPNDLSKCGRLILTAIVQHGDLSLAQAAIIAGYASDSGGVRNAAGELRTAGFVEGGNQRMSATPAGRRAVADAPKLPTGKKLAEYWFQKLDRAERLILGEVLAVYPKALSLKEAAKRAGYEPDSGGVRNAAGKLRTLELVHGGNAGMTADKRLV